MVDPLLFERARIREVIDNWVLWRDAGDWERFRTVWHAEGRMMATWFQGSATAFIEVSREGWRKGVSILHFLGGSSIDLAGRRAIAQTKMTISQRATVDGVLCDVVCTGRFYDFFEAVPDRSAALPGPGSSRPNSGSAAFSWKIVLRQPIYEKDRLDPVDPAARPVLDAALLAEFPEGYRHLAYLQTRIGFTVKRDMPQLKGAEVERLYDDGARWLAGQPLQR